MNNILQPFYPFIFSYLSNFVVASQISARSQPTLVSWCSNHADGGVELTMEGSGADSESAAA